ncbi:MAG: hypothetical protein NC218_08275 [Acetobacter sp.]|nr:hypothetical protein [Acetobacter sp.]
MADELIRKPANFNFYLNTQGVRGRKGEKGDPGFSPSIVVSENTLNTYKLRVTTADGTYETDNLRGSIITEGVGSFIRYNAENDELYVGDIDVATPEIFGTVKLANEDDYTNMSETAVVTVDGLAEYLSTHLVPGDDSVTLSFNEDTGVITITAKGGGSEGTLDYTQLQNKPKLYGTEIEGDKKLSDYVKIKAPLVETEGVDYENDVVIQNGTISENAITFKDDWHPLFSLGTTFETAGAYSLTSGPDFIPNSYISIPYKIGDIIEIPAATGADTVAGAMSTDNSKFTSQFVLRTDGLTSGSDRAVVDITSKSVSGSKLICGFATGSVTAMTGMNFDRTTSYFQITLDADGSPEFRFVKNVSGTITGQVCKFTSDTAKEQVKTFNRILFSGTDVLSNPINQLGVYHITDGKKLGEDLKGNVDIDKLHNYLNLAFPDAENALGVSYDNDTIVLNANGELCTSSKVATKEELDGLSTVVNDQATEINTLDMRVEALEDQGGGGGTSNYEQLTNKPQINGVELVGDKSDEELGVERLFTANAPLRKEDVVQTSIKGFSIDASSLEMAGPANTMVAGSTTNCVLYSTPSVDGKLNSSYFIDFPFFDGCLFTYGLLTNQIIMFGVKDEQGLFLPKAATFYYSGQTRIALIRTVEATSASVTTLTLSTLRQTSVSMSGAGSQAIGVYIGDDGRYQFRRTDVSRTSVYTYVSDTMHDALKDCNTVRVQGAIPTQISPYLYSYIGQYAFPHAWKAERAGFFPTASELTSGSPVFPTETTTQRYLQLGIDNDTLKTNASGQLYADIQGLPSDITATSNDTTVELSSSKKIKFNVPMMEVGENLTADESNLYLNQGSVEAGENITIDKTATGIRVNSTGGGAGGDISELEAAVEALKTSKQDKLQDTKSVAIVNTSATLPADTYTLGGSATVDSANHLVGTKANSYLSVNKVFAPGDKPWEIQAKFVPNSTGASSTTYAPLIAENSVNKSVPQLYIQNGGVQCDVSYDGTIWNIEEFVASTTEKLAAGSVAYARLKYDGAGTYTVGFSRNGTTWFERSQTGGSAVFQSADSMFTIGADAKSFGRDAYQYIDLNETYIKIDGEYFWRPFPIQEGDAIGAEVKISASSGNTLRVNDDGLFASGGTSVASAYGARGDYCTTYGILDCPNGLIDYEATGKKITINPGIVLKCPNKDTKTTIASAITKILATSTGSITIFYAGSELLECGEVYFQEDEPGADGVENYQAWWKPSEKLWYFRSNDTGNVFRSISGVTPLADIKMNEANILSVDYIGYRILNDDIIPQLSEIESLHNIIETLQETIANLSTRVEALETKIDGGIV